MERATVSKVSIVIRAFNEGKHIGRLLHGCRGQSIKDLEIILVDSGSTDDTVEIAEKYDVKLVKIKPQDFSFGRALNLGCREATGEVLVFASAHVYPVFDDWIERLIDGFVADDIAAVYGKQRGNEVTKFSEHQIFKRWFPEESTIRQDTPFCNNANCAIRKSRWLQTQYDEQLTGLEDLAWAREMMSKGHSIGYAADALIIHVHEETPASIYNRYMREAVAMKRIYEEQTMSVLDFSRLMVQNTGTDLADAAREGSLLKNVVDIPRFRLLQFWGAYQGFRREGPVTEQLKRRFYYPRSSQKSVAGGTVQDQNMIDYTQVENEI